MKSPSNQMFMIVCAALLVLNLAFAGSGLAQTWAQQTIATTNLLDDVWFTDSLSGWVVGDVGTSFWTSDGGQTWNQVTLTGQDLGGVAFLDPDVGLIVGDNGLIFRTVNGGINWSPVASGTDVNLDAVIFGTGGRAYAVGRDGTIVRSTDAGASWTVAATGVDRYRGVWARGDMHAWVVGDGGVILVTTDGGLNWSPQNSGTGSDLKGVYFHDTTRGWIAGQNSTLLFTDNGGATWAPRESGIDVGLDSVHFVNASEGWAVGNLGRIFHTIDGGLSWLPENSNTSIDLSDVFFSDLAHGWAVGDLGTVLSRFDPTPVGEEPRRLEPQVTLAPGFPNPFNPSTTISFQLPRTLVIKLDILDVSGRYLRNLESNQVSGGQHVRVWDGKDDLGRTLPSGVYFARLETMEGVQSQKLVLTK